MMNSSSESVNANSAPAKIAGMISGRTTWRKRKRRRRPHDRRDGGHLGGDDERRRQRVLDLVVAEHLAVPVRRPAGERKRAVLVRVEAEQDEQQDRPEQEDVHERR